MEEFTKYTSLPPSLFTSYESIEDYLCVICSNFPNPHTAIEEPNCGHLFCDTCINSWYFQKKKCPICRGENCKLRQIKVDNKPLYHLFEKLALKCPYPNCEWKGQLSELDQHLSTCQMTVLKCKNYCGFKAKRIELINHEKECPNRESKCTFCEQPYMNKLLAEHEKQCERNGDAIIPCKYSNIGCLFKGNKKERVEHEEKENKEHLRLAMEFIKAKKILKDKEETKFILNKKYKSLIHVHPLEYKGIRKTGWACNARHIGEGGCKSGITGFYQTFEMDNFRCDNCDFDLCLKCMLFYLDKEVNN